MKLIANMPVRNAAWVLGVSARVALLWCDALVILLHACTDRSAEIAAEVDREHPGRVRILTEDNPKWLEMDYRQRALEHSRTMGASHVAIVDADEILSGNLLGTIRSRVEAAGPRCIVQAPIFNLRDGIDRFHANGIWGNRYVSLAFGDAPRVGWSGDRWHHREPEGASTIGPPWLRHSDGGVMHLWGSSLRRLKAHHAHYKVSERLRWPAKPIHEIDATYSLAIHGWPGGRASTWEFSPVPESWWSAYAGLRKHLDIDSPPWEEEEVRLLLRQHPGVERGLDLFGVDVPNPLKEMPGRLGQLSPEANAAWADIEEAECARRIAASPEP